MAALLAAAFLTVAFQANQQTGTIEGNVVKLGSNEPLPDTRVGLVKADGGATSYSTTTGPDGRFRFAVEPGIYRVLSTRDDGFIPAEYGQSRPNTRGLPITVGVGETKNVRLEMAPPAAISGRVLDRNGEPIGQAQVQALRPIYREGRRSLTIAQAVHTNDLGEYRLYWLPPGPYYLSAKPEDLPSRFLQNYIRPPDQQGIHEQTSAPLVSRRVLENGEVVEEVNVPIYFPGTTDFLGATPITLRAGDDLRRVDINMAALPPARRIQGTVIDGTTGQPLANGSVRAILQNTGPNVSIPNALTDAKGAFEITGAQPGAYFLFASPSTDGFLGGRGGRTAVEVGAKDLENITVLIPPAFDIPGRFIVEGKHDLDMTGLRISIRRDRDIMGMPSPQQSTRAGTPNPNATKPDGSFTLSGLGAGDYRIGMYYMTGVNATGTIFTLPQSVYLKSLRLGNLDLAANVLYLDKQPEGQLEIVLGTDAGAISGMVVNDARQAVPNTIVTLVPEPALRLRTDLYRTTASDASGRFNMRGLAPGDYKLFAWDDIVTGAWLDPEFIQQWEARGTPVQMRENSTANSQVTIIKVGAR